ncbi:MAG: DNA repair protein RecN [Endomicrobia bacterium]|nr:DNA repair protein RecN [Bacillota bacterium]MCL1971661.1 DNA repair protein RecN [Endomicrobiia bacterium]
MLLNLNIKNYALIEDLSIEFGNGFTVISGETGAGKSILVKSIELLTGARADSSNIRSGCSICTISASFEFKNPQIKDFLDSLSIPLDDGNAILIRRTIESTGKSKAYINDSQVSVSSLAALGNLLIDFHNQDEKHSLLNTDSQLEILDKAAQTGELKEKAGQTYEKVKDIKSKIEAINLSDSERERKIDLYSFQLQEIEDAKLENGEDSKLESELPKLKNAEKISSLCEEAVTLLYSGENPALSAIIKAKKNIEAINSLGADASEALSLIEQSYYQAEESYREVENILSETEIDPEKLNETVERIELIKKLKKKYGSTISEIAQYQNEIEQELKALQDYKENTGKLDRELQIHTKHLRDICEKISQKRKKAAVDFCKAAVAELEDLGMKNAVFEISFKQKEPSANGCDEIEFMFSANKGEKILPLKNTASGGELSRVLLAIEVSSKLKSDQTTIFDEIDTGTGGKTGEKIGKKLSQLAKNKQVFSITHLAQVSAFAQTHIKIYKEIYDSRTYTKAKALTNDEHIEEIARMISGEKVTKSAVEHAKDLIKTSTTL